MLSARSGLEAQKTVLGLVITGLGLMTVVTLFSTGANRINRPVPLYISE